MRTLEFDFRRDAGKTRWPGLLLLALALASAFVVGVRYRDLTDEVELEQAKLRDTSMAVRRQAELSAAAPDREGLSREYRHASELLGQLTRPWGELFASAESAMTADVALLGIESDIDGKRVNISGEAKNLESILEYLRGLAARPALADVYLQSHEVQLNDPQHPVRFTLSAHWMQNSGIHNDGVQNNASQSQVARDDSGTAL